MADSPPKTSRALALGKTVAKFAAGWLFLAGFGDNDGRLYRLDHLIRHVIYRVFADLPSAARYADVVYQKSFLILGETFLFTLFLGTGLAVLGGLTRMIARGRVRAGQRDFLDGIRGWTAAHPKSIRALCSMPGLFVALLVAASGPWHYLGEDRWLSHLSHALFGIVVAGWCVNAMATKGVRELLAPTLGGAEAETRFEIGPDEIAFDAVAVTPRTVAIVGVFTALMIAIPFLIARLPILELFRHGVSVFYLFGGYAAFAASGAYAFRKASRVAIGVDGVLVKGTARSEFLAYRDLDAARVESGDLLFIRGERIVLRLQLHGEDALKRDAVLTRIRGAIDRVKEGRRAVSAQLVSTATPDQLARAAGGAADYRGAALTRAQLWELVEGPEVDSIARRAAAQALATTSDPVNRARLRVAADQCADPPVRVALTELADVEASGPREAGARTARAPV